MVPELCEFPSFFFSLSFSLSLSLSLSLSRASARASPDSQIPWCPVETSRSYMTDANKRSLGCKFKAHKSQSIKTRVHVCIRVHVEEGQI